MWPLLVVPSDPTAYLLAGLGESLEVVLPDAFFLQAAEEPLDHPVLLRRVRGNVLLFQTIESARFSEPPALEDEAVVRFIQEGSGLSLLTFVRRFFILAFFINRFLSSLNSTLSAPRTRATRFSSSRINCSALRCSEMSKHRLGVYQTRSVPADISTVPAVLIGLRSVPYSLSLDSSVCIELARPDSDLSSTVSPCNVLETDARSSCLCD